MGKLQDKEGRYIIVTFKAKLPDFIKDKQGERTIGMTATKNDIAEHAMDLQFVKSIDDKGNVVYGHKRIEKGEKIQLIEIIVDFSKTKNLWEKGFYYSHESKHGERAAKLGATEYNKIHEKEMSKNYEDKSQEIEANKAASQILKEVEESEKKEKRKK